MNERTSFEHPALRIALRVAGSWISAITARMLILGVVAR
jgi:hypothetical protein